MPEKTEKKDNTKIVDLKVGINNHTHDGVVCKKGDRIQVPAKTAKMLEEQWDLILKTAPVK